MSESLCCPTCGAITPVHKFSVTPKQHKLLEFIDAYCKAHHGVAPSFDQMQEALSLKSKSGVHGLVTALEERGAIRRIPYRCRTITVVEGFL